MIYIWTMSSVICYRHEKNEEQIKIYTTGPSAKKYDFLNSNKLRLHQERWIYIVVFVSHWLKKFVKLFVSDFNLFCMA